MDDRPPWARRIRAEREARGWSQTAAVRSLIAHSPEPLPDAESLLRNWKRWESGAVQPDEFYAPLIAQMFGTVTAAMFPIPRDRDTELVAVAGMDTLEILTRLRHSTVDQATLDGLRITVDQLACDYPHLDPAQLLTEGRQWLARITTLLDHRLTLAQHRDVLALAGWLALLVACVEYDTGAGRAAEGTRRAALSLGQEAGNGEIQAWGHEIRAWMALTNDDHRGVITASSEGLAVAGRHGVAVQLQAQKAKAWARLGDRRQVEVALEEGRQLLESLPHPGNIAHHFAVDPAKWDFYSMDAYRILGEADRAELYAREVIRSGTDPDGRERAPMRIAEARVTLGVVAAQRGDVDHAIAQGQRALGNGRQCLPSLLLVSRELKTLLQELDSTSPDVLAYADRLCELRAADAS